MSGATNTIFQLLRSNTTAYPTSLNAGEPAYSYVTDKLFLGNTDNSIITIGGEYYTNLLDNATSANTGNTFVRRDVSGNVEFNRVSIAQQPTNATDATSKSYVDSVLSEVTPNTIFEGIIGSIAYSNVHASNTSGGYVSITADNSTVARFDNGVTNFFEQNLYTRTITANGTIYTDNLVVAANVNVANIANVAYYASVEQTTGEDDIKDYILLTHGTSGNTTFQANTLLNFDTANTTLSIGYTSYTPLLQTLVQSTGSDPDFIQNNIQNLNNEGSGDYVATADNGNDSVGYIDLGINGGNVPISSWYKPNDGYVQVVGQTGIGSGNLFIATGTANTEAEKVGDIYFAIGNQNTSIIVGYISRENQSLIGTVTWAIGKNSEANSNYSLDISGSANASSLFINNMEIISSSGVVLGNLDGGTF